MSGIDEMPESVKAKQSKRIIEGVRGLSCDAIIFDGLRYCMPSCEQWVRIPIIDNELTYDVRG